VLSAVARFNDPAAGQALAAALPKLQPAVRPQALDALASRAAWATALLDAIDRGAVDPALVNSNQVQRLAGFGDAVLAARVVKRWGAVRQGRNPEREKLVRQYRDRLEWKVGRGDAENGAKIYQKVCAQCHQYRGTGVEVGPKLDDNGKAGFEQLLVSIMDPSLVIGNAYQARLVQTADGRALTGLVVEDSPARLVLKVAGAKLETIAKADIERMRTSEQSLMPEGLEKQMTDKEFRDLLTYLLKP
jgi:putative heme-binding domain-containing protein